MERSTVLAAFLTSEQVAGWCRSGSDDWIRSGNPALNSLRWDPVAFDQCHRSRERCIVAC